MRLARSIGFAASLIGCTAFGSPAFAQAPSAYHQGVVVPALCTEPNAVAWTTYNGHHALFVNHSADYTNLGFIVFGNRTAVLHGQIPQTIGGAGPLPLGNFTFQIAIAQPKSAEIYINAGLAYPDGYFTHTISGLSIANGQTVTSPLIKNSVTGAYPQALVVFFDSATGGTDEGDPDSPFQVIAGNFMINGVSIPGTVDHVFPSNDGAVGFCGGTTP